MKKIILLNEKNEKMYFFSSEELRVVAEGKKLQPVWKDTVFRTEDKIYLRGRNNLCRQIAEKARFLTFPAKEDIFRPQVTSWGMRAFFDHGNGKDKLTELSPELADAWMKCYQQVNVEPAADNAFVLQKGKNIVLYTAVDGSYTAEKSDAVLCGGESFIFGARAYLMPGGRKIKRAEFCLLSKTESYLLLAIGKDVYIFTSGGFLYVGKNPQFFGAGKLMTVELKTAGNSRCYQLCSESLAPLCTYPTEYSRLKMDSKENLTLFLAKQACDNWLNDRENRLQRVFCFNEKTGLFQEKK